MNPLRHQLASTSPVGWRGIAGALRVKEGDSAPLAELEAVLRETYHVAGAFPCGSGTEALGWALTVAERLSGTPRGPVALPGYSCFDLAAAAVGFGRPVKLYDLDPGTLGPDPESLRRAIHDGARSVVVAGLYGVPIDWDSLAGVIPPHAIVIEDAAQGHGARWKGDRLGGWGRLGVLSFGRGKGWTGGAGGALLVRHEGDLATVRADPPAGVGSNRSVLVRALAHRILGRPGIYRIPRSLPFLGLGETRFHPARALRPMAAASAFLLLDSREAADGERSVRVRAAEEYRAGLAGRPTVQLVQVPEGGTPGYVRFPVVIEGGMEGFTDAGRALRLGAARGYPAPLASLSQMAPLLDSGAPDFPGVARLVADLVTLPTHAGVEPWERKALLGLIGPAARRS